MLLWFLANKIYTLSWYGILIYIYLCNHCPSPLNCLVIADVQVYSIQPYMIKSLQQLMAESFNGCPPSIQLNLNNSYYLKMTLLKYHYKCHGTDNDRNVTMMAAFIHKIRTIKHQLLYLCYNIATRRVVIVCSWINNYLWNRYL